VLTSLSHTAVDPPTVPSVSLLCGKKFLIHVFSLALANGKEELTLNFFPSGTILFLQPTTGNNVDCKFYENWKMT
jgi:hypothetical protein